MHRKTKGSIAELAVAGWLMKSGWHVLLPYGENMRYDLAAERSGKFIRIQVKYVTPKNGALYVNCCSSNNWSVLHYSVRDIDMIAVYNPKSERIYFVPVSQIRKNAMLLRLKPARNGQKKNVRYADTFSSL